jgi:hypothetical protein
MLHDLDASLRRLLGDADAPAELRAADVSFVTPYRDYAPSQPTVNLFLHQVHEHAELRDPGWWSSGRGTASSAGARRCGSSVSTW